MVDIFEARTLIESRVNKIPKVSGTGVNLGTKSIIVYVNDSTTENRVRSTIGNNPYGFNLLFIYTGKIISFQ